MRISNIKTAIRKAENDQETLKGLQIMLEEKQAKLQRELTQIEELLAFAHEKQESLGLKLREQERDAYGSERQRLLIRRQRRRRNHVQPRRFRTAPPLC